MLISKPPRFREVSEADFVAFLAVCADYTSDSLSNYRIYKFRHNGKSFAYVDRQNGVFVDPELLQPTSSASS